LNVVTLCLGILALGDASGYEIKKRFDGPLRRIQEPSFGSIYPALTRLTREGLVSCTVQAQEKRPDKKVYSITPAGRAHLKAELQKSLPGPDKVHSDFLVTMLFQEMLTPDFVAAAVDERIAFYRDMMSSLDCPHGSTDAAAHDFVCGYGMAVCRAAIQYLESYRRDLPAADAADEPNAVRPASPAAPAMEAKL
jgi:PadR family transcriptional regulator, regulatory protein AphA